MIANVAHIEMGIRFIGLIKQCCKFLGFIQRRLHQSQPVSGLNPVHSVRISHKVEISTMNGILLGRVWNDDILKADGFDFLPIDSADLSPPQNIIGSIDLEIISDPVPHSVMQEYGCTVFYICTAG